MMTRIGTNKRHAIGLACIGLLWAVAASCTLDEREVQLSGADPNQPGGPQTELGMLRARSAS